MKSGDIIEARVNSTVLALTLDDRVLPDRSCGQYEAGWWAQTPSGREFFVSDEGIVYAPSRDYPDAYDYEVGRVETISP